MSKFFFVRCAFAASLLLVFAGPPYAPAAQRGLQDTFPARFGRWLTTTSPIKTKPSEQELPLLSEAGLQDWLVRPYTNGSQTLNVGLKVFSDPSGAYEAYTASLDPQMQPSNLGPLTAIGHERLLALVGNIIMQVDQPQLASTKELQELAGLVRKLADTAPLPPVRKYLPSESRVAGSERYALGPVAMRAALIGLGRGDLAALADKAGFSDSAEAMLAAYSGPGEGSGILVLLEYPTPQLAEQHIHHLDEVLPAPGKQPGLGIVRKGSLLSLVLSPSSAEYTKNLRAAINYETQVTWNEPSQTATDPPIASVMVKIFIGTGVFMVAAFVLGIAFGGVRVITKILFPGKVFDRPNQMEILQLGLSSKRIDPSDFY
ncbi:MAG: DUF6599 family protein [Candidatus Acidiferrum sp.]